MRDPERIDDVLSLLHELWEQDKDLRFFQLIYILQTRFSDQNGDIGKITEETNDGSSRTGYDLFNVEDDRFISFLKDELERREQTR